MAAAGKWAKAKRLALQLFAGNEVVSVRRDRTLRMTRWQYADTSWFSHTDLLICEPTAVANTCSTGAQGGMLLSASYVILWLVQHLWDYIEEVLTMTADMPALCTRIWIHQLVACMTYLTQRIQSINCTHVQHSCDHTPS